MQQSDYETHAADDRKKIVALHLLNDTPVNPRTATSTSNSQFTANFSGNSAFTSPFGAVCTMTAAPPIFCNSAPWLTSDSDPSR